MFKFYSAVRLALGLAYFFSVLGLVGGALGGEDTARPRTVKEARGFCGSDARLIKLNHPL